MLRPSSCSGMITADIYDDDDDNDDDDNDDDDDNEIDI